MFKGFFSRLVILVAVGSFVLHSDSAWAAEIKPHLQNALDMLDSTVLPQVEQMLSKLL